MRVVTLLPSATEIVCALGMQQHLVGVSHSCNNPPGIARLPKMTSTLVPYEKSSSVIDNFVRQHLTSNEALYNLDIAALEAAAPDVIVSQALCDVCAVSTGDVTTALNSLSSRPQIIDLEPHTLDDVFDDCLRVAKSLGAVDAGRALYSTMQRKRAAIAARTASIPASERPGVVFLEWLYPPFNGGHWNPQLVTLAGGIDLLGAAGQPSSTLSWPDIVAAQADVLFIACCGFSMDRALQDVRQLQQESFWNKIPAVAQGRVFVADGNQFYSRPGPGLLDGLEIMAHALHPQVHPVSSYGSCVLPVQPLT